MNRADRRREQRERRIRDQQLAAKRRAADLARFRLELRSRPRRAPAKERPYRGGARSWPKRVVPRALNTARRMDRDAQGELRGRVKFAAAERGLSHRQLASQLCLDLADLRAFLRGATLLSPVRAAEVLSWVETSNANAEARR